jgi:hypothetical protein
VPNCSRCVRTGRTCTRGRRETRFRQAKGRSTCDRFPSNQVWLRPPPRGWTKLEFMRYVLTTRSTVDFVLESGSGEPDDLTERPSDNPSPGRGSVGDADSVPLSGRPSSTLPQYHGNGQQTHAKRSGRLSPLSMGDILERPHQPRSWPLRDPQEAHLLQHFVDKIAPFVSIASRGRREEHCLMTRGAI